MNQIKNHIITSSQYLLIGVALLIISIFYSLTAWASTYPPGTGIDQQMEGNQDIINSVIGGGGGGATGSSGPESPYPWEYSTSVKNCFGQASCSHVTPVPYTYKGQNVVVQGGGSAAPAFKQCVNTSDSRLVAAVSGWRYRYIPGVWGATGASGDDNASAYYWAQPVTGCSYADWVQAESKTCFYNAKSAGSFSRNLSEIKNLAQAGNRKPLGLSPGSPTTDWYQNCNTSFMHAIQIPTTTYGYYALYLTNQHTRWVKDELRLGSTVYNTRWNRVGSGITPKYGFYSFSCNADNPYNNLTIAEGSNALNIAYNSFVNKVNAMNVPNYLNAANCPQTIGKWECNITDNSTIGLDRAAVAGRSDLSGDRVSVMRNGDPVRLTFGAVKISDYDSNGNETVITPGVTGSVVRNLQNVNYRDSVVGRGPVSGVASTPWNSDVGVNSKEQYFVRRGVEGTASTDWDKWVTHRSANSNREYSLHFNWASNPDAPFVAAREYQVTADFLVPSGSSGGLNNAGNFVATGVKYDWHRDTRQCLEKTGAAGSLVETNTPMVSKTNPVDVLRSTGDN